MGPPVCTDQSGHTEGKEEPVCKVSDTIPFDDIKYICEKDRYDSDTYFPPSMFATHRQATWPHIAKHSDLPPCHVMIYDAVQEKGIPNCMGPRIPLPTNLNISAWERYAQDDHEDAQLIDFIKFGFPLGYLGPPSDTSHIPNHDSAQKFPDHVDRFVHEETQHGAFLGPLKAPPFLEWSHTSPIMSRPKSDSTKRRVITDLTFPQESSINTYIMKNSAMGRVRQHKLPTISDIVSILKESPEGTCMFTIDIARAYRNFKSDPLDWPLLCVQWKGSHFIDVSMPFGARASSCHMQRVADFIMCILRSEGMKGAMDDLIIIAPDIDTARVQYDRVCDLLLELGLPQAPDKAQPPATVVTWLGITIDACHMSLSIPQEKVVEILEYVRRCKAAKSMHKRQLQSLIGKLMHLAKCVEPAHIFMARLLEALRAMKDSWYVKVDDVMRADLVRFEEFAMDWNGRSLITKGPPRRHIMVDACLTGIGATDGTWAYAAPVAPDHDPIHNITEIEAANVIVVLHTFISAAVAGTRVAIHCDNMPSVQALTYGKADNPILAECARAAWMIEALFNVKLCFIHVPGIYNPIADALRRAHSSQAHHDFASRLLKEHSLHVVRPCRYFGKP